MTQQADGLEMDETNPAGGPQEPEVGEPAPGPALRGEVPGPAPSVVWLADGGLIALFLALTFLLGVFPLKDTDFYWHLRTGDLIRQTGRVPRTDIFTFTREGTPWIDLHWIFQVAISWLFERGGVVALNLAKCGVTCVAVLLLVTARRRDWPIWVMLLAWLPAILLLGGRMYVRPETLSLLYLAIFLAVVMRWDRYPLPAMVLPLVQVAWVNTQGLFVFGPIVLACALIGAVLRPGAFAPDRRRWWRIIGIASAATLAACLVNPYGIVGALYPLQLAGTMSNPIFSRSIAELKPIPEFIKEAGLGNLPLQLHLITLALGALSFLLPLAWVIGVRLLGPEPAAVAAVADGPARQRAGAAPRPKREARSKPRRRTTARAGESRRRSIPDEEAAGWRLSPFRLLLYAAFSSLSLQATRNSHQFAAVVGTITAWNLGEWAAALRRRRGGGSSPASTSLTPRLVAGAALAAALIWVGSGWFYAMTGEQRTIGLGEEPLWFPHQAARFAGRPEMPARFLSFHNGHASLFIYYHGPGRKVFTDPRLEVSGAELFERYQKLERRIVHDEPGWTEELDVIGRPVVLVDHDLNATVGARFLKSEHWRCVWFDAIAAVFVHDSATAAVREHAVDFAARHFRPDPASGPRGAPALLASAKAMRNYLWAIPAHRGDLIRPLVWLGLDAARRVLREAADSGDAWKLLGQIELCREPAAYPSPRFRLPYDPVLDLSIVRATYALRRAVELGSGDFTTLWKLSDAYRIRLMDQAEWAVLERLAALRPINRTQRELLAGLGSRRAELLGKLGAPPPPSWRDPGELDQIVAGLLAGGRAETAAELLEQANPPERAPWEILDRIATLRLHLGEPARARALWEEAAAGPEAPLARARIGATYLAEGDFEAARRAYRQALAARPDLFEACYSLAVLEQDAGHAAAAHELALRALPMAPGDASRAAARRLAAAVARFAPGSH